MSEARIVDFYAVLAVPPTADLMGIQNAYARLTDQIATLVGEDETIAEGMVRLNQAYGVLSNPEARRKYDAVYFSREILRAEKLAKSDARRRNWAGRALIGALLAVVLTQGVFVAYLSRETTTSAISTVLGPFLPGSAN